MAGIENIDKYTVKLSFDVDAKVFEDGLRYSYNKNKNHYNIQGFRKGKAPRKVIETVYGSNVFYEDAINEILPAAYQKAVKELNLHAVSKPEVEIVSASTEDGVSFTAKVMAVGEASVDEYYSLTYKKYETEPTDEEIQKRIDVDRDKNARIITVVRPVKNGDIITIDYDGYVDDAPFEGGHAEDYRLIVGEHMFIDNFEEQLIGAETGENIFVRVKFPENYEKADLAGKPAVFDVKIKEIQEKELPEMDDDFAQDVSEFETFDEYRDDIIAKQRKIRENDAKYVKEDQVMSELASRTTVDIPPVMIENRMDVMLKSFEEQLKYQGMPLDEYLRYIGQTKEQFRETYRPGATNSVITNLALEAVARKEGLTPSEDEINAETERLAHINNWNDKQKSEIDTDFVFRDLSVKKAYDFVMDHALEIA